MKMSKLGFKIFVIFIIVSIGGLLLTSVFINYRFNFYFKDYLQTIRVNKAKNLKVLLEESYSKQNDWSEAYNIIGNFASLNDFRVILKNSDDDIITFNTPNMYGRINQNTMGKMNNQSRSILSSINNKDYGTIILKNNDKKIGELLWQRSKLEEIFSQTEDIFMSKINRSIFFAALITALVVIGVTYYFSKYLTNSLNKMNRVAREVADGNLKHDINIRGHDEVAELGASFNQMIKKLKYLEKIRNESASDLAHELRTPLSNIKNYIEAIEDGIIEWNLQTALEIEEEIERLIKLINRLNELNEAEAKILNVDRENFNLEETVELIVKNFNVSAQEKNLYFQINYNAKPSIYGDKNAIKQILNNIISNAVKYSLENEQIVIDVDKNKNNCVIAISNMGPKIKNKDIPYLFERFYRTDKSRENKDGGLGIGLTITRNLVEAHGGKIEVKSDDKLTSFIVYLPYYK